MQASDVQAATGAAASVLTSLGLSADDAVVLRNSDKLMLRLLPCDIVARIEHEGRGSAAFELELAQRLVEAGSPVVPLDPRAEPRVHRQDGFAMTLWTYYDSEPSGEITPAEYADALHRLHAGMRRIDMVTPRFTDRVAGAQAIVANRALSPELSDDDRDFLADTLRTAASSVEEWGASEQVLHGEPHLGNVLVTKDGLLFVDLETCCRGPVEFDIAHAVRFSGSEGLGLDLAELSENYPGADPELVRRCVVLMLALITTWRWNLGDQLPDGPRLGREWLDLLRSGLEDVVGS